MTSTRQFEFGDLSLTLDGIDLRDVRWQGGEAIRRIYPVFQDRNWTNRPFRIHTIEVEEGRGAVEITATGHGTFDASPLLWSVEAHIDEVSLRYQFSAQSTEPFLRNRLGLCVLHPMGASGCRCWVRHVDGTTTDSVFPEHISPHQPFVDIASIEHVLPGGARCNTEFSGDIFEMEDHRNWSDASFKTYCTPISDPFPVEVVPGAGIDQSVRLSFTRGTGCAGFASDPVLIEVSSERNKIPKLGTTYVDDWAADQNSFNLHALDLDHLRVEVDVTDPNAVDRLETAARCAVDIGARLRVATTCESPQVLERFRAVHPETASLIDCWYLFSSQSKVTPDGWATLGRTALGPTFDDVPLGGGTNLYFTELNREPPKDNAFDVLNFSLNPQVHAFDDRTLIQNTVTQRVMAQNARRKFAPAQISVAPITLRPRFNPNATDPAADVSNTPLPADVDARQCTTFAAIWTAMSIKYLAESGSVDTATYFDAFGWKGLAQGNSEPSDSINFAGRAGERFPIWEVFRAIAGMTWSRRCESSAPEAVDALLVDNGSSQRAVIVNWTDHDHEVLVNGQHRWKLSPRSLTVTDLPNTTSPSEINT